MSSEDIKKMVLGVALIIGVTVAAIHFENRYLLWNYAFLVLFI